MNTYQGTTDSGDAVPTVVDNAFELGLIENKILGVSFEPLTSFDEVNGELTFGGVDPGLFNEPLTSMCVRQIIHCNAVSLTLLYRHAVRSHKFPRLRFSSGSTKQSSTMGKRSSRPLALSIPVQPFSSLLQVSTSNAARIRCQLHGHTPDALAAYVSATGAVFNEDVGLYQITPEQFGNLQSLFFTIGDASNLLRPLCLNVLTAFGLLGHF